jgi:hypothetical protein
MITFFIVNFYNKKHFHDTMLHGCDCDHLFWSACIGHPQGVANEG